MTVSDPLFTVSGAIASFAVGASDNSTFSGTYTLNQNDIDNGYVDNLATATGTSPSNQQVTAQSNAGVALHTLLGANPQITLTKSGVFVDANNDGFAQVGETINYSFVVENSGNQTLSDVIIDDPIVNQVNGYISTFLAGAIDSTTFSAVYTLTQQDIENKYVDNLATVYARDPSNTLVTAKSNAGVALRLDLSVEISEPFEIQTIPTLSTKALIILAFIFYLLSVVFFKKEQVSRKLKIKIK